MTEAGLADWPAARVADAVRSRAVPARAFVDACLRRIDARNPALNAVISRCDAAARAAADALDRALAAGATGGGPLCGVPITIKDMNATAGLRTTYGLPWYRRHVPDRDGAAVARLRAAGAIVLGKTNVPLAGYDWQTRHPTEGVTRHPADPSRTCGGSSGGAAVAVATGMAALELGADLAGSIRVPAHFCGVFGLKTSDGAIPLDGHGPPESRVEHLCVLGPIARDLGDLRLAFDVLTASSAPPRAAPTRLRIAWTDALCGLRADAATRAVLAQVVGRLAAGGHEVERAVPPGWDSFEPLALWAGVDGFEFRQSWPRPFRTALGRQLFRLGPVGLAVGPSRFSRAIARAMAGGRRNYERALEQRAEHATAAAAWLASRDLLLAPCAATAAFHHRRLRRPIEVDGTRIPYSLAQSAFCCPVNVAGACALVTPAGRTADGLPIGLQWIAAPHRDHQLIERVEIVATVPGTIATI
jgi:amidase